MTSPPSPTAWFEPLYAAAARGDAVVPWARGAPQPLLEAWTGARRLDGRGRRALVVGCGLGDDAEHIAALGFETVAFDVAPTAIRTARERFPRSGVAYAVADLLAPPPAWRRAFDLVVESLTVQALPGVVRPRAIAEVGGFVAPGGTLLVLAAAREDPEHVDGPPWPLTRAEVASFAGGDLRIVALEQLAGPVGPGEPRWRAELRRDAAPR